MFVSVVMVIIFYEMCRICDRIYWFRSCNHCGYPIEQHLVNIFDDYDIVNDIQRFKN